MLKIDGQSKTDANVKSQWGIMGQPSCPEMGRFEIQNTLWRVNKSQILKALNCISKYFCFIL